jgi:uncharacterized protein YmfQ (DUF2313 family)
MGLNAAAYSRQIKQLFPQGKLWNFESTSVLSKLILAIAAELARIDARGDDLVDEWDPRTTGELIGEWETMLGLETDSTDLDIRRLAATGAFIAQGGCTEDYFSQVSSGLGFHIDHFDYPSHDTVIFNIDLAESDGADTVEEYEFCSGSSCGTPIYQKFSSLLEDKINKIKHAHIDILFYYFT